MHSTRATKSWPRRRAIIALAVLLCIGCAIAWRVWPQHDPRLVGIWLNTYDGQPLPSDAIERVSNGERYFGARGWKLQADGSGIGHYHLPMLTQPYPIRWRTRGDRLYIRHDLGNDDLLEELAELWKALRRANHLKRWREHQYVVDDASQMRVVPLCIPASKNLDPKTGRSYYELSMTRYEPQ